MKSYDMSSLARDHGFVGKVRISERVMDDCMYVAELVVSGRKRPFQRVISRSSLTPYADPVIYRWRISAHADSTPPTLSCRAMAGLD